MLTGTPAGAGVEGAAQPVEMIGALLPPAVKWKVFFDGQQAIRSTSSTVTSSRPLSRPTTV